MQLNQEIFILVAEELSISHAAKRAFVTQQCVSDHIKRLEQQYGIALFTRKPRFQLTEHGRELLGIFYQIKHLEQSAQQWMHKRSQGQRGSFTMGISPSRAPVILPWVLPGFRAKLPEVTIDFLLNDTVLLEESLLKGEVDLFLGINANYHDEFEYFTLGQDEICIIISDCLLQQVLNGRIENLQTMGIDLHLLEDVPFVGGYTTSAVKQLVQSYLAARKIKIETSYRISDTTTQIALCARGICAAFVPKMLLSGITHHNSYCAKEQYLHVLSLKPLEGVEKSLRIELVSRKGEKMPPYILEFQKILLDSVSTQYSQKWRNSQLLTVY